MVGLCCTIIAEDFIPRTLAAYDYHSSLLDGCLADSDSVSYGVNLCSPLNDLKDFHVANVLLPQDVMRALLDVELNLLLVALNHFSKDCILSL